MNFNVMTDGDRNNYLMSVMISCLVTNFGANIYAFKRPIAGVSPDVNDITILQYFFVTENEVIPTQTGREI